MRRIVEIAQTLAATALGLALGLATPSSPQAAAQTLSDFIRGKLEGLNLPQERRQSRARALRPEKHTRAPVITPPLPRPRPVAGLPLVRDAPRVANGTLLTDSAGRVIVDPGALARERDHERAVYLKPREIGQWDEATARRARRNCEIVLATLNVDAEPAQPIGGPRGCGIAAPVRVRALGAARLKPVARLNCRFTAALHRWMREVVQPAARKRFGQPVVAIRQLSHYACRSRGGITRGPVRISEHSFGNALDIGAFELADGTRISILKDWGEISSIFNKKSAFLKDVRDGACKHFSTVLSPRYNKAHANHFHLDLGRGGRHGICK